MGTLWQRPFDPTGGDFGPGGTLGGGGADQVTPVGVGGPSGLTGGGDLAHAALRAAGLARALAQYGAPCKVGYCLQWVRGCYSAPGGVTSAALWWAHAPHPHPGDYNPPAGAPVAWTGGSKGDGHIAISDGTGHVITTDFPTSGRIGRVAITAIGGKSLHFAGWAEPDFGPGT